MGGELTLPCKLNDLGQMVSRQYPPAERILDRDQSGNREMRIVGLNRGVKIVHADRAVGPDRQRLRLNRAEHGRASSFPQIGMSFASTEIFLAALAMAHDRSEIGHGAGRQQQSRFL